MIVAGGCAQSLTMPCRNMGLSGFFFPAPLCLAILFFFMVEILLRQTRMYYSPGLFQV